MSTNKKKNSLKNNNKTNKIPSKTNNHSAPNQVLTKKILEFKKGHTWSKKHETSVISRELDSLRKHMKEVITNMDYDDVHASLILPVDKGYFNYIEQMIKEKEKLNPEIILVIGIGGSNLGTMAVQEAVLGKISPSFKNTKNSSKKNSKNKDRRIYYIDTIDPDYITRILNEIKNNENSKNINSKKSTKNEKKKILAIVISKSGKTTETIVNFEVINNKLKLDKDNIVFITDRDSALWNYGIKNKISTLEVPKHVGGRYSVFSAVGLFPLGIMGIDIKKLIDGAYEGLKNGISSNSIAVKSASEIYIHYKSGQNIHNTFLFSNDLESLGKWYRQLMGESLGKEFDLKGRQIFIGITPTYCIGSTDLHSMGQQYLGGPFDTFTTFVSIKNRTPVKIKSKTNLVDGINNKTMEDILNAILSGVKRAYKKTNRPFISIELSKLDEKSVGYFMQMKMMEIMFIGHLLNINPFNQPNVELYKKETRKILRSK